MVIILHFLSSFFFRPNTSTAMTWYFITYCITYTKTRMNNNNDSDGSKFCRARPRFEPHLSISSISYYFPFSSPPSISSSSLSSEPPLKSSYGHVWTCLDMSGHWWVWWPSAILLGHPFTLIYYVWFWSDPDAIARCAHAPQVLPSAPLKLQQSETALRFLFLLRLPGFFIWNTTTTCQKSAVADIHGRYYSQPCLCQRQPALHTPAAAVPPTRPPARTRTRRPPGRPTA